MLSDIASLTLWRKPVVGTTTIGRGVMMLMVIVERLERFSRKRLLLLFTSRLHAEWRGPHLQMSSPPLGQAKPFHSSYPSGEYRICGKAGAMILQI